MYPGTAFTRSIGDAVAERIGVFAQPEVDTFPLTAASRFAVVASDGVFEFLPSQAVADMVSKFEDPLEACLAVVAESYRLWLQYETRTDDITIIVIKFLGLPEALAKVAAAEAAAAAPPANHPPVAAVSTLGPLPSMRPTSAVLASGSRPGSAARPGSAGLRRPGSRAGTPAGQTADPNDPGRPVRRSMARSKRDAITASLAATAEEDEAAGAADADAPQQPKTAAEAAALAAAIQACFLFAHLTDAQRTALLGRFVKREVLPGEWVCQLGERGDAFFVVDSGEFDVYLCAPAEAEADATGAKVVHSYAVTKGVRPSFGELALLYNQPRTASVRARGAGALWVLSRAAFRASTKRTDVRELLKTLRTVEVLKSLSPGQLQRLADCLSEVTFQADEVIIKQGDVGDAFYIIVDGTVSCATTPATAPPTQLTAAQTFGERALLSADSKRTATVSAANGAVKCLRVSRTTFEEVLGPLAHIIDADRRWRERAAAHRTAAEAAPSVGALRALKAADLGAPRPLWACDVGRVAVARLAPGKGAPNDAVTIRQVAIGAAVAAGRQASVMRERELAGLIAPMPFIPAVMHTFADDTWLTAVLQTSAVCSLAAALSTPLAEAAAAHYVAEAALALEHIHWHGVLFRGLSPDTALLDADGHLQLCDFRFAKQLVGGGGGGGAEGRTFTLCGHPEYLAPEVVKGTGHADAADWWALGCFAWWLLTHHTPFAGPGDVATPAGAVAGEDLQVYKRIVAGAVKHPASFSAPLRALLDGLLAADPDARGSAPLLRASPWFAAGGVDWDALCAVMTDEVPVPPEAKAQLDAARAAGAASDDMHGVSAYTGDRGWFADF
jgi:CRP-like cAMP-binding protein